MNASRVDGREGALGREASEPPNSQRTYGLEIIHSSSGQRRLQDLMQNRVVIGSGPQADVVLDDPSVLPIHAELIRGPSGQWWIHNLDSDAVTSVHSTPSRMRELLTASDDVAIGAYKLRLKQASMADATPAVDEIDEPPRTVRLGSLIPPGPAASPRVVIAGPGAERLAGGLMERPIGAWHLSRVMSLTRELIQTQDAAARRRMLCEFIATDDFAAETAAVVRLTGPATARVVEGPVRQSGTSLPLYLSQRMTERFWETRRSVCYYTNSGSTPLGSERKARIVGDCPHLDGYVDDGSRGVAHRSCLRCSRGDALQQPQAPAHIVLLIQLGDDTHSVDGLFVELDGKQWGSESCAVVALVAEAFQQAELVWQMRSHVRQTSSIERELEMARKIQQSLVPQQAQFDSLHQQMEVVVGFEPCHWVGGDYADAVPMPDGRVLLAVADVCGKGMEAALVASSVHTFVRATVDVGLSPTEIVSRLNRHMCRYLPDHVFITMLCVAADLTNGDLEVVSAGHPPALIAESTGHVFELDIGRNVGLGVTDSKIVSGIHRLGPDQILFLYTDGLTEAENKQREPLGMENLARMLSSVVSFHGSRGPHAMREAMLNSLRGYRGSLLAHDDTTFLMARLRNGEGRLSNSPPAR